MLFSLGLLSRLRSGEGTEYTVVSDNGPQFSSSDLARSEDLSIRRRHLITFDEMGKLNHQ